MKNISVVLLLILLNSHVSGQYTNTPAKAITDTIPSILKGNFVDDYGIRYSINDTLWTQFPKAKYHIISCDTVAQYLLARNDDNNPGEAGLYTRLDYMLFSNMEPYNWGFCLTIYNAATITEAQSKAQADRQNPKKGCNGFQFSRMKRKE